MIMVTKCENFFFSSIIIIASAVMLFSLSIENILLMGLVGAFNGRFFRTLELNWVLQVGLVGFLVSSFVVPSPLNSALAIGLGFSEVYLLARHLLNTYSKNDFVVVEPKIVESKAVKLKTVNLKVIDPVLIQVRPAQVESSDQVPNLMHGPVPDTLCTLEYASVVFSKSPSCR